MRMMVKKKISIALIIILLTIVVIFICGRYYFAHNKSYKNEAIDSGRKLYEIEEYPDYEYIAGYYAWDGVIYKKDETD